MQNCESLLWYGWLVLFGTGWLVIVPYLRGRAELLSAWNMLLVGIAIFIGVGSLEAALLPMRFHGLDWFEPTRSEVARFVIYSTAFLLSLFAIYSYDPSSKAIASRCFNKWPPLTTNVILFILMFCLLLAIAPLLPTVSSIPLVGPVLVNVSHKSFVFACTFSFLLWYRQRTNLLWLGMFVIVFLVMCLLAIQSGGGRRLLLTVFFAPVLSLYYFQVRYWKPVKCLAAVGLAALVILVVGIVYATFRHFDRKGEGQQRSAGAIVEQVKNVDVVSAVQLFTSNVLFNLAQQNVHYGMLIDQLVQDDKLPLKPLNTLAFLATYPIPRYFWAGKPLTLGRIVGTDVVPMFARNEGIRWGCGIAGQAAYEGGLVVVVLYAYLAALCVRLFDDPLLRQPTNPFLIGMMASASAHIVAWPRGDLGIMSIEIIECFFFVIALGLGTRFLFGVDRSQSTRPILANHQHYLSQLPTR